MTESHSQVIAGRREFEVEPDLLATRRRPRKRSKTSEAVDTLPAQAELETCDATMADLYSEVAGSKPALKDLPSELLLSIIRHLDISEVNRLGATCRTLLEVSRSDEAWRLRVESIVNTHLSRRIDGGWVAGQNVYDQYVNGFLSETAKYLGWWASTQAYRGRLMRISVRCRDAGPPIIVGEEVFMTNGFARTPVERSEEALHTGVRCAPTTRRRWKPQGAIWDYTNLSYRLPDSHPSPHAGFDVDIFDPILEYTPIFSFSAASGFRLFSSGSGSFSPSIPISLNLSHHYRRKIRDISPAAADSTGFLRRSPSRYASLLEAPGFPSRDAIHTGLLRRIDCWDGTMRDNSWQTRVDGHHVVSPAFVIQAKQEHAASEQQETVSDIDEDLNVSHTYTGTTRNGVRFMQLQGQGARELTVGPSIRDSPRAPIHLSHRIPQDPNDPRHGFLQAMLAGLRGHLPQHLQHPESLLGELGLPNDDDQEHFYPIDGPLMKIPLADTPIDQPFPATSLCGMWAGTYSLHGHEFGRVTLRTIWTRPQVPDLIELKHLYDSNTRTGLNEEMENSNDLVTGLPRCKRTIIEFVKVTGDLNVPAGQVSWVAMLPAPGALTTSTSGLPVSDYLELPTVLRSDWERWSDVPIAFNERTNRRRELAPHWATVTIKASGRVALSAFTDTRFIDAEATFIREDTGEVDEIRVKWHDMGKVTCFRRCRLD